MNKKYLISSLIALFAISANAATDSKTITATTTVDNYCSFSSVINPGAATYKLSLNTTSAGSAQVTCTRGSAFTMVVGAGQGTISNRYLLKSSTGEKLYYNIYTGNDYSQIYGDGNSSTYLLSSTTSANPTFYYKIPSGQRVSSGAYTDSVSLTINF